MTGGLYSHLDRVIKYVNSRSDATCLYVTIRPFHVNFTYLRRMLVRGTMLSVPEPAPELIKGALAKIKWTVVDWCQPPTVANHCGALLRYRLVRAEMPDAPDLATEVEVLQSVLTRLTERIAKREGEHPLPFGNSIAHDARILLRLETSPVEDGNSLEDILDYLASTWKRQTPSGPRALASGATYRRYRLQKVADEIYSELAIMAEEAGFDVPDKPAQTMSDCFDVAGLAQLHTQTMPGATSELQRVFRAIVEANLEPRIIRHNWVIDVEFDLSRVNEGVIAELLIWDYELVNISRDAVAYDMRITSEESDGLTMRCESFERISPSGNRVSILDDDEFRGDGDIFVTKTKRVMMEPGVSYALRLYFRQEWAVDPKMPRIYNVFGSSLPCINTTLRFAVPKGYELACTRMHERLERRTLGRLLEFVATGVTPVGMVIEYVLRPAGVSS